MRTVRRYVGWLLLAALGLSGSCGGPGRGGGEAPPPRIPPHLASTGRWEPGGSAGRSGNWTATIYYTAVESFYAGPRTQVTGCSTLDCLRGGSDLGSYPQDFIAAVRAEGTGRTAGGRYLNWSFDTGFWLDDAPRDTAGRKLRPFESAAADPATLPPGTRFRLVGCGVEEDRSPVDPRVCRLLCAGRWVVTDEFTPGLGGPRHVDLYIGEQTAADFTESIWYATLNAATLEVLKA